LYINTFLFQNEYLYRKDYMYKNFNLTEVEKEQILNNHKNHGYKKPLNENMGPSNQSRIVRTLQDPVLLSRMETLINRLSDESMAELEITLQRLGITASSSPQEIHNRVEAKIHGEDRQMEMPESVEFRAPEMTKEEKTKRKLMRTLEAIGAGNIAAWGGVPAAIVVGSMSSMPTGFAVSWGATALLYAAAKAIEKTIDKNKENEK
jgi:hypothetical protein